MRGSWSLGDASSTLGTSRPSDKLPVSPRSRNMPREAHRDRSGVCRNRCIENSHTSTAHGFIVRCRSTTPKDVLVPVRFREASAESREPMSEGIDVRPRNWLVPVALVTLREKNTHGYELMERLPQFGFEEINSGTLYRTLRRMEKEGLCDSEWATSDCGPACRVYSVTDSGEAHLDSWAEGCKRYQQVLDAFSLAYAASS